MEIRYFKHWSTPLKREMEFKVYGSGSGKAVLFIPCQAGRFWDFESFKMIDYWAKWIEAGECTVYSCDSIDNEAWAAMGADNRWRIDTVFCKRSFERSAGGSTRRKDSFSVFLGFVNCVGSCLGKLVIL